MFWDRDALSQFDEEHSEDEGALHSCRTLDADLTKGKWMRNPFVQEFRELKLVSLENDVKAVFPDSESVNAALRTLIKAPGAVVREKLKKAS